MGYHLIQQQGGMARGRKPTLLSEHRRLVSDRLMKLVALPEAHMADLEDRTGYGQHADYVFGWKGDSLQNAMDTGCYINNCKALTTQQTKVKNQCSVKNTVSENTEGCKSPAGLRNVETVSRYFLTRVSRADSTARRRSGHVIRESPSCTFARNLCTPGLGSESEASLSYNMLATSISVSFLESDVLPNGVSLQVITSSQFKGYMVQSE